MRQFNVQLTFIIPAAFCVILNAGCVDARNAEANAAIKAARGQCDAQYPKEPGFYGAHAKCVNAAIDRVALPLSRNPDLIKLQEAFRSALSAKIDRGEMLIEDAQLQMAEADLRIAEIERSRRLADQTAAANSLAAFTNFMAAMQASSRTAVITNC
jgi:hypothetical protein